MSARNSTAVLERKHLCSKVAAIDKMASTLLLLASLCKKISLKISTIKAGSCSNDIRRETSLVQERAMTPCAGVCRAEQREVRGRRARDYRFRSD